MTSMLKDFADMELVADDPEERFITNGVSWEQYETVLAKLEDSPWYHVTYLEGLLEVMSPSRRHERSKTQIGMFLEAYFQETLTPFWGLGSTTFRNQDKRLGTEPDECYCIGTEKDIPDLAIEVVVTSGGVDKLEVYRRLGVREVWFWQDNQFQVYCLRQDRYEKVSFSELLPTLDLELLAEYVVKPNPLTAVLEFRQRIRSGQ